MTADWAQYTGLPVVGTIETDNGARVVHISETYDADSRDEGTFYVASTTQLEKPVVFLFIAVEGGLLLQVVQNRSGSDGTDGMCAPLSVGRPGPAL